VYMWAFVLWFAVVATGRAEEALWNGPGVNLLGGPSRDGKILSYVDPATRNLALRDLTTGQSRTLTQQKGGEYAYFSSISRDTSRVAYAWFNADGFYELRVVGTDGAHTKTLFRNEEAGFVQPCAWTPDDRYVLTLLFRKDNISQIVLIPADGGAPKVLRSLMWVYPKRMDLSPDGKYIVYDSFAKDNAGDRTLFILSTTGKGESKLIDKRGDYLFPLWTADGRRVVYVADHGGTTDLWAMNVMDGKPLGTPQLLCRDLGRVLPMGITTGNRFIYGVRAGETDVFVTTLTAPRSDAKRASVRYPGRNVNPAWSRDGEQLAYLSRRGSENFGQEARAIVIRSLLSGEERELLPRLAHMEQVRWSPDGASLLVSGSDGKGRAGLYIVDVTSAAVTPVIRDADAPFQGYEGVWSGDGKSVVYLYRDSEVRSRLLGSAEESVLHQGAGLHHLVASHDGKVFAVSSGGRSIILLGDAAARSIPFSGATELDWSCDLIAARGAELWRIPVDGSAPVQIETPGNRKPGFSVHPDGNRIALTVSNARSEVWALQLTNRP
jgi:Tol biopolymer transport system component